MTPRPAEDSEIDALADLWTRLWQDAHADHCPPELIALRTRDDFHRRLLAFGDDLRVIGPIGMPQGLYAIKGNHIDQLFLDRPLWGTGAADVLTGHALARIRAAGHDTAMLECNTGNARAARYYRKSGWTDRGVQTVWLDSSAGPFALDCIVFDRALDG